jgi:branched-chain amino acid transport system permease protein
MGDQVLRIFGAGIRPQEVLVFGVAVAIMLTTDVFMRKSRIGKAMRAVAHNPQTASLMGINTQAIMIGSFAISGVLAGIAGVLIAPITSASLFLGLSVALKGFSGAILGGLTSARGCILGGFVLGVLESIVAMWQAQWREVVIFLIIILILALRPNGLFGRATVDKV